MYGNKRKQTSPDGVFVLPQDRQLWVPLVEKAYAKALNGAAMI